MQCVMFSWKYRLVIISKLLFLWRHTVQFPCMLVLTMGQEKDITFHPQMFGCHLNIFRSKLISIWYRLCSNLPQLNPQFNLKKSNHRSWGCHHHILFLGVVFFWWCLKLCQTCQFELWPEVLGRFLEIKTFFLPQSFGNFTTWLFSLEEMLLSYSLVQMHGE